MNLTLDPRVQNNRSSIKLYIDCFLFASPTFKAPSIAEHQVPSSHSSTSAIVFPIPSLATWPIPVFLPQLAAQWHCILGPILSSITAADVLFFERARYWISRILPFQLPGFSIAFSAPPSRLLTSQATLQFSSVEAIQEYLSAFKAETDLTRFRKARFRFHVSTWFEFLFFLPPRQIPSFFSPKRGWIVKIHLDELVQFLFSILNRIYFAIVPWSDIIFIFLLVLLFEFLNSAFGHFCLDVFALLFTVFLMLIESLACKGKGYMYSSIDPTGSGNWMFFFAADPGLN